MTPADRQRLAAILGMLGSDYAGERAAAALQAEAFRKKHRMTWAEMLAVPSVEAAPEPQWTPSPPPPPSQPKPEPFEWAPWTEPELTPVSNKANPSLEDRAWMALGYLTAGGFVALLLTILTQGIPWVRH